MADVHHETVFFAGRVQGVGFRYTTLEVARGFDVCGYVKNLADGRVQLEVEGKVDEINSFISAVEDRLHGYVRKTERSAQQRPAQFSGFTIK
jgi:acylphosphatase